MKSAVHAVEEIEAWWEKLSLPERRRIVRRDCAWRELSEFERNEVRSYFWKHVKQKRRKKRQAGGCLETQKLYALCNTDPEPLEEDHMQ